MATEKIGIYRRWLESVPSEDGQPVPREQWPQKRRHHWEVRWFGLSGKRYSQSFPTRKEAEQFARQMQEKVNHGKSDKPDKILLKDFIEEHKKLMPGQIAPTSLYEQVRATRLFEKFIGGNIPLQTITPKHAEAFISQRISSGVTTATVNKDILVLKRVFNLAIYPRGYLDEGRNPFARMKQRKKTIAAIRYVSIQEYRKLINASNPWWRAIIAIAYGGGLRREEILNLIWQDIDFEKKQIHIQAKSNSSNLLDWEPKDHENRIIPITDQAIKLLTDLFANSIEGHPYVFVSPARLKILKTRKKKNPWDQTPDTVNNIMRQFEGILKKAGIAKCTLHDLRRSAITNWAQHLPIQVVQNLAGHSNITTTRKYYLAVLEEDMTKASKVINAILQPAKTD